MSDRRFDPHDAVDFIIKNAPKFAEAKARRVYLEEFRKTKKALLMKEHTSLPIGAQEREAYAHPEYQELLQGLRVAIEVEETLRWQLTAATMRGELYRTQSANERAEGRATQ